MNTQLCHATVDFTSRVVGPYTIKIFEPNDPKNPDIWQGPICVHSEIKKVDCGFALSLIKSVTPAQDRNSIDVVVFSGTLTPITGTSLYAVSITASGCADPNASGGPYTGFAALRTQAIPNDTLVIAMNVKTGFYWALFGEFQ